MVNYDKVHDKTDYLYERYVNSFGAKESGQKPYPSGIGSVLGVALFGIGRAGGIHIRNLLGNARVNLLYVVETDDDRWNQAKTCLNLSDNIVRIKDPSGELDQVMRDSKVDAVIISTPTFTHEELVDKSLEAGKAVFCEKPLAETVEATRRLYAKAEKVKKPLLVAFNRRFDPSFKDAYQRVRAGEVGHVQQMRMTSRDSPLPELRFLKTSGGIYHDCVVHNVDQMCWMLGEFPDMVMSIANSQIPEIGAYGDFDNLVCNLTFRSGTIGSIDISRYASYGYDQRLEVFGPKGLLTVDNDSPTRCEMLQAAGNSTAPMYWSFPSRFDRGYVIELEHFFDVVQGQDVCSIDAKMTLAATKIVTALEESARAGGQPVKLTWTKQEIPEGYNQTL